MKNRKQLPRFGYLRDKNVDMKSILEYLECNNLLNWDIYNDIKASNNGNHTPFVKANAYSKENFFKESAAEMLEGDQYVQLYLTDFDNSKKSGDIDIKLDSTIFTRTKRLNPNNKNYLAEADELNYGIRNEYASGIMGDILDLFKGKVTRARLACLKSGMEIKPHVDYDPSYISRYHIPLITNEDVKMYIMRGDSIAEYSMPADGRVYFFNSGLKHWVQNNSTKDRLHLIVDVHGQEDMEFLQEIIF